MPSKPQTTPPPPCSQLQLDGCGVAARKRNEVAAAKPRQRLSAWVCAAARARAWAAGSSGAPSVSCGW